MMDLGNCSICFEKMSSSVIVTDCNHHFHRTCIRTWLCSHSTCPLCRYSLTNDKIEKQESDYEIFEVTIVENDVVMFTPLDEPINDTHLEEDYNESDEEFVRESDDEDYVPSDEESEYSD